MRLAKSLLADQAEGQLPVIAAVRAYPGAMTASSSATGLQVHRLRMSSSSTTVALPVI
jgi:hypothetical protein